MKFKDRHGIKRDARKLKVSENKRVQCMKIVALDISGNFKEGKGTTGIAELIDGEVRISSLSAKHHSSPEEYWHEVIRDTILGNQMLSSLKAICSTTTRA